MASLKLLLAVSLCLAASASAQTLDPTKYTCPTGWIPFVPSYASLAVVCAPDPCYGACGAGTCVNSVQGISGSNFPVNTCTCKPPAVLSHIVYRDFCYVQGTDVCNPSPCKNGATCAPEKDFNGQLGAYTCTCPTNYYGRNCDIVGPPPTPTPKGMPAGGGSDPYRTF